MKLRVVAGPMFAICSLMTAAHKDATASDPQAEPPRPAGQDGADARARLRVVRRVGRWLGRLGDVAVGMVDRMRSVVAYRREDPTMKRTIDLDLGWGLLARAMRWTRALRVRLKAEAEAAKAALKLVNAWRERPEQLNDWDERGGDDLDWVDNTFRRLRLRRLAAAEMPAEAGAEAGAPDDCIDGLPTGEVVEQICNDLGIAAVLLRSDLLGQQIAAVAAEAHALLGGAGPPWTAPPIPPARHPAANEQRAKWQAIARHFLAAVGAPASAPAAVAAPDSG
jgi:hypothetical protein